MVRTVTLDCARLTERDVAHGYLAEQLELPAYYGRNLDALFDCLTEMGPCAIVLENSGAVQGYGRLILDVLKEATQANPWLTLETAEE